ncbi:hypothetical protein GCM10025863_25900 [Microbacterium suwonense]|uniref:Oligopeptide transport permease C-like N-terminal domain-containing protein n=1 Tax=Microbacterium suwonense TaxID=683047 RepID=A0ABN6X986_9MICO|nr:hypothetical protein GCM10025863_25900 [Microbacterium suwonense]
MTGIPDSYDEMPTPQTAVLAAAPPRRKHWAEKVPVLAQLRQSVGLQRGMLVTGLAITILFIVIALLAPCSPRSRGRSSRPSTASRSAPSKRRTR